MKNKMKIVHKPSIWISITIYLAIAAIVFLLLTESSSGQALGDYPIVDTGQTACYNDDGAEITCPAEGEVFYGQDAQYTGNEPSYTDNGDGTVTDNVTGLMWQQTPDSGGYSWSQAGAACESLQLAGYDDWRLPSLKELFSISNFSQGWPCLDTTYFDLAGSDSVSKDEQYWTSNDYVGVTVEGGENAAIGVNHATGHHTHLHPILTPTIANTAIPTPKVTATATPSVLFGYQGFLPVILR